MLSWLSRRGKAPGWFVASLRGDVFDFAHGSYLSSSGASIDVCGSQSLDGEKSGLQKIAAELRLERYRCATLLQSGEYQLLLVEAPNVPKPELKAAMRWRVKDMLDYHVNDATLDLLDIPPDESKASRAHLMYAVCARNEVIQGCVKTFQEARIPLSVIDIPETAQRNIGALFEDEGRGLALVYFAEDWGLLTINFRGELFLARRLEIGVSQLGVADQDARRDVFERAALELQRTFDHFDRQFQSVPVARLLVAPMPQETGLTDFLAKNVTLPVESLDLGGKLGFAGPAPDAATQWRLFHHFGAALRHESKGF